MRIYKTILILIVFILSSCGVQKRDSRLKSYEIYPSINLKGYNKNEMINELKFEPKYSELDAIQYMYQKFGKWNNSISIDRKYPLFVWKNIKLMDGTNELYTVAVSGEKFERLYYCSAIVYNSKNENSFNDNSPVKDTLIKIFIKGTENINLADKDLENIIKEIE